MPTMPTSKGPWIHRFAIHCLTVFFAVLIYWLLGFLVDDIQSLQGPDFSSIEAKHLDRETLTTLESLSAEIAELTRQIEQQEGAQRRLEDSSQSLQQTLDQLLELQKLSLEKDAEFSHTEDENFTKSLSLFLENQTNYQELGQHITVLLQQKQALEKKGRDIGQQLEQQRWLAHKEYTELQETHRRNLALLQLALLVPLLAVAVMLILRQRTRLYFPFFLALGGATLLKAGIVIHAYFPTRYFRYILIGALLLAVARILIYFIRGLAFPKTQWLMKQYREAYERFLCPVCEYPIRLGPRKFLYWTRRTVNKLVVPGEHDEKPQAYTCPSCGIALFEECSSCHNIRHALLPHCMHCGVEKVIE